MLRTVLILLAALTGAGVARLQARKPAAPQAEPIEIRITCPTWGQELPRAGGNGFDLIGHTIRATVDRAVTLDTEKLPALLKEKAKALPAGKPRRAVVGFSVAVTYGDIVKVTEIALDAGFDELELALTFKGARAPAAKQKPKPAVERVPIELVLVGRDGLPPGIVPADSNRKPKSKPQALDASLVLDFDQSGNVKQGGKLVYRLAPLKEADTSKLVAAVQAMAKATAEARNAGEPTRIFVRADRCTEAYLIRKVLEICSEASSGFDGFALVVTPPPGKKNR